MGLLVMVWAVSVVMVAGAVLTVTGALYAWAKDSGRRWAR
jgi:hypothetical protein